MNGQVDYDFSGSARAHSAIEIFDGAGRLLARTTSGQDGRWAVAAIKLPAGRHTIHASAKTAGGTTEMSDLIVVECEAEQPILDDDAPSERALAHYFALVDAAASGFAIDGPTAELIIDAVGRSIEDFNDDVLEFELLDGTD